MGRQGDKRLQTEEADFPVGSTLRRLRKQRGMSLQALATASGVSVGMISQVERGLANPSMRLLTSLRRALNITLQEMFGEAVEGEAGAETPVDPPHIRRREGRPVINLGSLRKELLSAADRQNLQLMILEIDPGGETGGRALSYPAEKAGLVLKGRVVLTVDDEPVELREGDSFVFDSARPHSVRNLSEQSSELLWIIGAMQLDRHV